MTKAQISYILTEKGLSFGEWYTLENIFQYIAMNSDKMLHFYPKAVQFYFSEDGNYLLLRYTHGHKYTYEFPIPDGAVAVEIQGTTYLLKPEDGGIIDNSVDAAGVYHEIVAYECITGMFYK